MNTLAVTVTTPKTFKVFNLLPNSGDAIPNGMRLISKIFRNKEGAKEKDVKKSKGVYIPAKDWGKELEGESGRAEFMPFFISFLESMEEKKVQEAIEAGSVEFGEAFFSSTSLLKYLEEKDASAGRLSAERIKEWAWMQGGVIEKALSAALEKGLSETQAANAAQGLSKDLLLLASPKVFLEKKKAENLLRILRAYAPGNDFMFSKLERKLENMLKKNENMGGYEEAF